jgi:hypothetical protein
MSTNHDPRRQIATVLNLAFMGYHNRVVQENPVLQFRVKVKVAKRK